MTYRTIEAQVGIIHANLLDLNHYLHQIRIGELSDSELQKTESLLSFLRKHLNKPILLPRIRNNQTSPPNRVPFGTCPS